MCVACALTSRRQRRNAVGILIMPTDYCNMNCLYCFNMRKTNSEKEIMSEEMLYKIMKSIVPYFDRIRFIWHGGEPLSAGIDFYKTAVQYQNKFAEDVDICNSLQSNMMLFTDDYINFFIKNNFKIGASYDLSANDVTRRNSQAAVDTIRKVNVQGLKTAVISVVNNYNIQHLIEDYEWCKNENLSYTLNVYQTNKENRRCNELAIDEKVYIEKICDFFDYWMEDDSCNISIRYFNTFVDFIILNIRSLCCYNSCLGRHLAILNDGRVFACNRDFPDEYCFGNINDYNSDIRRAFDSEGFARLLKATVERRDNCKTCEIFHFCGGGCVSNAILDGDISLNMGYNCTVLIPIFKHIERNLKQVIDLPNEQLKSDFNPKIVNAIMKRRGINE